MSSKGQIPRWAGSKNPYRHRKCMYDSKEPSLASRLMATPSNLQTSSPLFSPKLPTELRIMIFDYALTEYYQAEDEKQKAKLEARFEKRCAICMFLKPDEKLQQWSKHDNYWWPNYAGLKKVSCGLLRTCRRAYLETYDIPPAVKEHVFWMCSYAPPDMGFQTPFKYFRRFTPLQLENVKTMHIFMSQWRLERHLLPTCEQPILGTVQKLIITIRRCDWDWHNAEMALDPRRGFADSEYESVLTMLVDHGLLPWNERGWGFALQCLRSLREFEMQLECYAEDEPLLRATARALRTWKFPCYDSKFVLSSDGLPVQSWTWERARKVSDCDFCNEFTPADGRDGEEEEDDEEPSAGRVVKVVRWRKVEEAEDFEDFEVAERVEDVEDVEDAEDAEDTDMAVSSDED